MIRVYLECLSEKKEAGGSSCFYLNTPHLSISADGYSKGDSEDQDQASPLTFLTLQTFATSSNDTMGCESGRAGQGTPRIFMALVKCAVMASGENTSCSRDKIGILVLVYIRVNIQGFLHL